MVFNPQGKAIGHIRLPERCANLAFGGAKRNRPVHGELPFAVRAVC
jgi:sugar lactone lactonase YvrE